MSILVTGATGFLGSALTTELIQQKQPVRILARDEQKARMQFGEAVTIIRGVYDISKAKAELGFVPGVGLDIGMNNTAEWYHKHGYL